MNNNNIAIGDPVYARVREHLRMDILSGEFETGMRLKIADLSRRYAVSQMPIREALQQLQGEGLVTIEPNKGARVRRVDETFIRNMYDIRGAIETLLVRLSVSKLDLNHYEKIQTAQYDFESAVRDNHLEQYLKYDKRFHWALYQLADNREAMTIVERYWGLTDCLRRKFQFGPARIPGIIREHRELLDALEKQDCGQAERIASYHCEKLKKDMLERMGFSV